MKQETLEQMLYQIKTDLASVKTDVTWLKRLFSGVVTIVGILLGVSMTGVI